MRKYSHSLIKRASAQIDLSLVLIVLISSVLSLFVLYSAGDAQFFYVKRQAIRLFIAMSTMIIISQIPFSWIKSNTLWINLACMILLIWVLLHGHTGKGAQRWIDLGFIRFEPSELFKIAIPLLTAKLASQSSIPIQLSKSLVIMIIIGIPIALVLLQPDLGTSIILTIAGLSVIYASGIKHSWILIGFAMLFALLPIAWDHLHGYQQLRIINFINPENDPLGTGYHIIQSKIAIGSGGIYGHGFLSGTQSHLKFLPEHSTDFVFALIAEEFGFIGSIFILTTFLLIATRGFFLAWKVDDLFSKLTIASLTFVLTISALINIAMTMGLLPVVGIPLPLISYGGSNLLTTFMTIGVINSASNSQDKSW